MRDENEQMRLSGCPIEQDIYEAEASRDKEFLCGFRDMCSQPCKKQCKHLDRNLVKKRVVVIIDKRSKTHGFFTDDDIRGFKLKGWEVKDVKETRHDN